MTRRSRPGLEMLHLYGLRIPGSLSPPAVVLGVLRLDDSSGEVGESQAALSLGERRTQ